jgi:hypothetical protein
MRFASLPARVPASVEPTASEQEYKGLEFARQYECHVLAGARFADLGGKLSFSGTNADRRSSQSKSWVDPFVGAQLNVALSDRWWFDLHGDIGGFDVGSKLAWQAYADVGYRASDLVSVYLGYRALDIDYESGSGSTLFRYDVLTASPQIGVAFRF